jgi:Flp pilus assembly protein TadD
MRVTLVQLLADETSVHMSCDFCLTNPYTKTVVQNDAHKLVQLTSPLKGLIGVTGVATFGPVSVGDWVANAVSQLGMQATIDDVCYALLAADASLKMIADHSLRRHSFVVASIVGTQTIVALVSNFESFSRGQITRRGAADESLTISYIKPKSPVLYVTGASEAVSTPAHDRLITALRAGLPVERIQKLLSESNALASKKTATVSEGCYVASLEATGRGSSRPFLTSEQTGDFIPPEMGNLFKRMGIQLKPNIGPDGLPEPIRLVQTASAFSGSSPQYFREQFKLRPDSAELWNNYGAYLARSGKNEDALRAFREAVRLDDSYAVAKANLANHVWRQEGYTDEADRLYGGIVNAPGEPCPAWIVSDYAVFCDEALKDAHRSENLHARAVADANLPLAKARYAYFLFCHNGSRFEAQRLLAAALGHPGKNAEVLFLVGLIHWCYRNDREGAREYFLEASAVDPSNPGALIWAAQTSLVRGDGKTATHLYRRLSKRVPLSPEMAGNLGLALLLEHKPDGALRHLSRAAKSAADNFAIRTNLAAALYALRRSSEAVELMRELLRQHPPPEIELELLAMLHIASGQAGSKFPARLQALVDSGTRADGWAIRAMVYGADSHIRSVGMAVADAVEGAQANQPS